jgi:hypothetical protein
MHARRLNAVASHLQVSTQHVASEEEYKAALVACRAKLAAFIDKMNANPIFVRDAMRCDAIRQFASWPRRVPLCCRMPDKRCICGVGLLQFIA